LSMKFFVVPDKECEERFSMTSSAASVRSSHL